MLVMRYCSLLMAGFLVFAGVGAVAQTEATLTAEKDRLARMEQSLENRQVEIENIENELLSYDYKLTHAQELLEQAHANYDENRRQLQKAERAHRQHASSDTKRQLDLARHSFAMAERGVDSRGRGVEIIESSHDELKAQLAAGQQAARRIETRIADQRETVERMTEAMLTRAEAAPSVTPSVPVSKPKVAAPRVASLKKAPEKASAGASGKAPAVSEPVVQREVDPELVEYVRREVARLDKLLGDGSDKGSHTFSSLELEPSRGDDIPFEFLGHNQYRLVAPVEAGRQTYRINTWKFRRTIPRSDDGERYVFVFDARRLSRPRLVMYPEYVLSYLD